ncbi:dNA repair protein, putative [Babesia ovata]|uniref:DNA repair protein, putative n=1 Tax=Babesia ovata TaxID=189622 RepID=A0A2H6KAX7_9APIC|nr:dNA repair protein, putative [Babesia ovata]GBE60135.1 dNA repair protein, putative [Babesia ovata]
MKAPKQATYRLTFYDLASTKTRNRCHRTASNHMKKLATFKHSSLRLCLSRGKVNSDHDQVRYHGVKLPERNVNWGNTPANVVAENGDVRQHICCALARFKRIDVVLEATAAGLAAQSRDGHVEFNKRSELVEHQPQSALAKVVAVLTLLFSQARLVLLKHALAKTGSFQPVVHRLFLFLVSVAIVAFQILAAKRFPRAIKFLLSKRIGVLRRLLGELLSLLGCPFVALIHLYRIFRLDWTHSFGDSEIVIRCRGVGRVKREHHILRDCRSPSSGLLRVSEGYSEFAGAVEAVLADREDLFDALALLVCLAHPSHSAHRGIEPHSTDLRVQLAAADVFLTQFVRQNTVLREVYVILLQAAGEGLREAQLVFLLAAFTRLETFPIEVVVSSGTG